MRKLILILIIIFSLVAIISAQRSNNRGSRILVNVNKPAVFITFLGLKEIASNDASDERKYLFFRITNNTRWNIWLQMGGVSKKEFGDARLFYAIEDARNGTIRSGSTNCHVCSVNTLKQGRSIIFSIPSSKAIDETLMRIAYAFDWERNNESFKRSYSRHYVEFYFDDLPKSIGKEKTQ